MPTEQLELDEVDRLLASAWSGRARADKKVLEYLLLTLTQELGHAIQHVECKQTMLLLLKTMYLVTMLLDKPNPLLEDTIQKAFGYTELRDIRRAWETLHK